MRGIRSAEVGLFCRKSYKLHYRKPSHGRADEGVVHLRLSVIGSLVFAALILMIASAVAADTSSQSSGLTSIHWTLQDSTYTWNVTNNSGANDGSPSFDVIIRAFEPSEIEEPVSWTAPSGWTWHQVEGHGAFEVENLLGGLNSSAAIAPGKSALFTYTLKPGGAVINVKGTKPTKLRFLAKVAAVAPIPVETENGTEWQPASMPGLGSEWVDAPTVTESASGTPETSGILVLTVATTWMVSCIVRARRREAHDRGLLALQLDS